MVMQGEANFHVITALGFLGLYVLSENCAAHIWFELADYYKS